MYSLRLEAAGRLRLERVLPVTRLTFLDEVVVPTRRALGADRGTGERIREAGWRTTTESSTPPAEEGPALRPPEPTASQTISTYHRSDGDPVVGAIVYETARPTCFAVTDETGAADLPIAASHREVAVEAPGFLAERTLAADQAIELKLTPAAGVLEGRVIDPKTRTPLSGVSVLLRRQRRAMTRADGFFRIEGLVEDYMGARLELAGRLALWRTFVIDGTVEERFEMPELGALEGVVRDGAGNPLLGATLSLDSGSGESTPGRSDREGAFALPFIDSGWHELSVAYPRLRPRRLRVRPTQEPVPLEIVLSPARPLPGIVLDDDEEPIPDARITARLGTLRRPDAEAVSSADGRFELALPSDEESTDSETALIEVVREGFLPAWLEHPLEEANELVATLRRATRLTVRVLSEGGEPVTDAEVRVNAPRTTPVQRQWQSRRSDPQGEAVFPSLPHGAVTVVVRDAGPWSRHVETVELPAGEAEVEVEVVLPPGTKICGGVAGPEGTPIEGAAVHLGAAAPADHWLRWRSIVVELHTRVSGLTDAAGRFCLDRIAPGRHRLEAGSKRHFPSVRTVDVSGTEEVVETSFVLRPRRHLELAGVVQLPGGEVLRNGAVELSRVDRFRGRSSGKRTEARTGADGAFYFAGLLEGTYTLRVRGLALAGPPLVLALSDSRRNLQLTVAEPCRLFGRLASLSVPERLAAEVVVLSAGLGARTSQLRPYSGRFYFSDLYPAVWQVEVHSGGKTMARGIADCRGQADPVEVRFAPAGDGASAGEP